MILSGVTGWKAGATGERRTPPAHRWKTWATINFLPGSPSLDRGGLFYLEFRRKSLTGKRVDREKAG
jgi:hypothetical protein